jgi:hypothetical protein
VNQLPAYLIFVLGIASGYVLAMSSAYYSCQ